MKKYFKIRISKKVIGSNNPVFIIAEVGVNHNGQLNLAKKMVDAASASGADAVKFQTFKADAMVTGSAPKADYQKRFNSNTSQLEMLKNLELAECDFKELFKYCKKKKIMFLSTPFDLQSAEFLCKLGVPAFKVSSGDLTDIPLLLRIAKYGKPMILSTGMSTLIEVKDAINVIYSTGNKKLILLHCTSNYPAKIKDVNLRAMDTIAREFNVLVGYSDHTEGIEVAIAAVARGACVIEKHLTLDNNLPGPDHHISLSIEEFGDMVKHIREIETALGDGVKKPRASEIRVRNVARKSVVADFDIQKGERMRKGMLTVKRPGTGIAPRYLKQLLGKCIRRNIKKDQILTWEMVG